MSTTSPSVVFGYGAGALIGDVRGCVAESTVREVLQALEFAIAVPDTDSVVVTVLDARFTDPAWIRFLRSVAALATRTTCPIRLVVPEAVLLRTEVRLRSTAVGVHAHLRTALEPTARPAPVVGGR